MTARQFGDLAYIGTAIALMLLSGGFLFFTAWWKRPTGRAIAAFLAVIFAIMLWTFLILMGIVSRNAPWLYGLRAFLFGALCLASWGMLIGFVRVQFPIKKKRAQDERTSWDEPGGRSRALSDQPDG
jgi:uncharacterized protein YhhL (DUF1145 family)